MDYVSSIMVTGLASPFPLRRVSPGGSRAQGHAGGWLTSWWGWPNAILGWPDAIAGWPDDFMVGWVDAILRVSLGWPDIIVRYASSSSWLAFALGLGWALRVPLDLGGPWV